METYARYGQIFQQIREDRGIKRSQLADTLVSASMIGKFERGDSRLSFDRVVHLVEKMNLSIEEFLLFARDGERGTALENEIFKFDKQGSAGWQSAQELYAFSQHLKRLQEKIPNDVSLQLGEQLFSFGALRMHYYEQNQSFDIDKFTIKMQSALQPIRHYLFQTQTWGRQEINIFIWSMGSFEAEARQQLIKIAMKRIDDMYRLIGMSDPHARLLISAINVTAYEEDRQETQYYLKTLAEVLKKHPSGWFQMRLEFEKGRDLIARGQLDKGYEMAKKIADIAEKYDHAQDNQLNEMLSAYVKYWQTTDENERIKLQRVTLYSI
jgi:transcriptional regulator with XRE-family HTH domain